MDRPTIYYRHESFSCQYGLLYIDRPRTETLHVGQGGGMHCFEWSEWVRFHPSIDIWTEIDLTWTGISRFTSTKKITVTVKAFQTHPYYEGISQRSNDQCCFRHFVHQKMDIKYKTCVSNPKLKKYWTIAQTNYCQAQSQ